MQMIVFGSPELARSYGCKLLPAPPNMACFRCHEWIAPEDSGVIQALVGMDEGPACIAYHYECHARMLLGSLGHQQGRCSCFGGDYEDPPEMSVRDAARAALAFARSR